MDKKTYHTTKQESVNGPEWIEWRDPPYKLASLRRKLYLRAKQQKKFRFYALYDRIYRKDVLRYALLLVSRKKSKAAGVDHVTIDQIVATEDSARLFIDSLHEELRTKKYKAQPIRRHNIPKANGKLRPLGIPTIKDRIVQTAALLILEPIFEADFLDCSFGFRPMRSSKGAMKKIRRHLKEGYTEVYDADMKGFFDSIPHDKLLKAISMRIVDGSVLKLIRQWIMAPIVEKGQSGAAKRTRKGTPQGGVISPLLANIYMHWFDTFFHKIGSTPRRHGAKLVRYADDFVVLCRRMNGRLEDWVKETLEGRMGLVLNEEKTSVVKLREKGTSFNFLGFTCRYDDDLFVEGQRYLNIVPSKKAESAFREKIRELVNRRHCFVPMVKLIRRLNRSLRGWGNYFNFGYPKKSFKKMDWFVYRRLWRHRRKLSQRHRRPRGGKSVWELFQDLELELLANMA